jgi:hypothetical protein
VGVKDKRMSLAEQFSDILPPQAMSSVANDLVFYGCDASKQFKGRAGLVLLPETEEQVRQIMLRCAERRISLVPSGGRTGYSGGATAMHGEVVVSMSRMNKILEVQPQQGTLRCQAGATTESIRLKAAEHGLFYPLDFASKGSSQIGGNIATNAGGIRVIRYGNTREWVLGLRVVTGAGELLALNGALIKNQTGYDLRHLFIGSEGTLGIVTEATLKLTSPPKDGELFIVGLTQPARVLELLERLRKAGLAVNVFEYFELNALRLVKEVTGLPAPFAKEYPAYALIELELVGEQDKTQAAELFGSQLEAGLVGDIVQAQSVKQRQGIMGLRERISESINARHVPHKNDISLPIGNIPHFLAAFEREYLAKHPRLQAIVFGHIGDGNLHINLLKPAEISEADFFKQCQGLDTELFALVQRLDGSISAEHGVGLLKRDYLGFSRSAAEIELMRQIKRVFDPQSILNPGKILAP